MDNPLCSPAEFQKWAENPVTVAYRQFLRDRQQSLAMNWAEGAQFHPADQGKTVELGELSRLSVSDVRAFYDLPESDDAD